MAKVTVAYKDLSGTGDRLETLNNEYVSKVYKEICEIKNELEPLNKKHDNCFGNALNGLDDLEHSFRNYYNTIAFMASQCNDAAKAFQSAESDSEDASKTLTDGMKTILTSMAGWTGLSTGDDLYDVNGLTEDDLEVVDTADNVSTKVKRGTAAERSATWDSIFADEGPDGNPNGIYDKINGESVDEAKSIFDPDGDDDKKPGDDNPEDTGDTGDEGGRDTSLRRTSPGGGDGGYSGGGGGDPYVPEPTPSPSPTPSFTNTITTETTSPTPTDPITPTQTPSVTGETIPSITPTQTVEPTVTPSTTPTQTVEPTPTPPSGGNTTTVTYHTGGGYSEDEGYVPYEPEYTNEGSGLTENLAEPENTTEGALVEEGLEEEIPGEVEDNIVKGDDITVIPTDSEPISYRESKGGGSFIPIAAGLSAAAAAGLGAKAYMDHKKNNSDEDMDEFESDEWSGDESTDIDYGDTSPKEEYLDDDDYVASEEPVTEKYGARNNEELADLQ